MVSTSFKIINQMKKEAKNNTTKKQRADSYRFLSACFYLPQKKMFLQENVFENLTSALKQVCPEAKEFSSRMHKAMLLETEENLAVDYAKLFVGPFELQAPPYGSVYLEKEKRVMGDSTINVLKMYNDAGLFIGEDFKEMPDHIALELEFMYYLIEKEIQASQELDAEMALIFVEKQVIFFTKYLMRWVPSFCRKIKKNTGNKFYEALADCLLIFLKKEQEHIQTNLRDIHLELEKENKR